MDTFSQRFIQGLMDGDIAALRACPKSDLHNHAIAGGDPDRVAGEPNCELRLTAPLKSMEDMHAWMAPRLGRRGEDPKKRLDLIRATFEAAVSDGVTRLAVGDDVWSSTLYKGGAIEVTRHWQKIHKECATEIDWVPVLGLSRHCPIDALLAWMLPFLATGFYKALDLYTDEFAQPIENLKPAYRMAQTHGLRLMAHVGEWGTADDVRRAVEELELDEVQHGIAAVQSRSVVQFLADHNIRLNICPTSNLMLSRVSGLAEHPIRDLYRAGVRVTINTDDKLVFGQSVSQEFLNIYDAGCLTAHELDQIRLQGLNWT